MQQPEDIVQAWVEGWNAGDATRLASLFTPDADFVNVVGLWWNNNQDIRQAHDYGFRTIFPGSTILALKTRVRTLGETAVVHAKWQVHGQITPEGSPAGVRNGIFIFVMQKFHNGWLCVAAQNTDIVPGVETHVAGNGSLTPTDYRSQ